MKIKANHLPCKTCPWRKSSTVGGNDIPGFSIDMMRNLKNTVGNDDAFRTIMACHHSPIGKESACRGYVAIEGNRNINVRILAAQNVIQVREIETACATLDLYESFADMLNDYESANK